MLTVRMFKPDSSRICQMHFFYTIIIFLCRLPVSSLASRSGHPRSKMLRFQYKYYCFQYGINTK